MLRESNEVRKFLPHQGEEFGIHSKDLDDSSKLGCSGQPRHFLLEKNECIKNEKNPFPASIVRPCVLGSGSRSVSGGSEGATWMKD